MLELEQGHRVARLLVADLFVRTVGAVYEATSNDPGAVAVGIEDGILSMTAVRQESTVRVTVTAATPTGQSAALSFLVWTL